MLNSKKVVEGKVREVYRITEKGMEVLEIAKRKVKELFSEIIEDESYE